MRGKFSKTVVCLVAVLAVFIQRTHAQSHSDACLTFVQNLKPDVLIQGSSLQQFSQLQQLVGNSEFESFGAASSSSLNGGLDIPGEVDAILGTKSDASNWGTTRKEFLSMNASVAFSNSATSLSISQLSAAALKVVDDCAKLSADRNGFSATLKTVSVNRDSFAVLLTNSTNGTPNWKLTQFSAQPPDALFKCNDGFEEASLIHPKAIGTQTQLINCRKDPTKHFTLGIQTSAGAAPAAFTLISVDESIQQLRDDMTNQIQSLASRLDKRGQVVAFAANACPAPWVVYAPAQGRFIRGLDLSGSIDPDGNLRSVGSIQADGIANHIHTMGVNGTDTTTMTPGVQRLAHFKNDGYGAGPKKETDNNTNGISETRPKNVALLYCTLP
jgi:hypothetical protein